MSAAMRAWWPDRFGADHRDYEVTPRFDGLVEKIVQGFDEPFADDSSVPSYFVCQMARQGVYRLPVRVGGG